VLQFLGSTPRLPNSLPRVSGERAVQTETVRLGKNVKLLEDSSCEMGGTGKVGFPAYEPKANKIPV